MMDGVGRQERGYNMQLRSGRPFFLADPLPEDIEIRDIAAALSKICRFGGHTKEFYSVAEHSVYVSLLVPENLALYGLLHDAAEAYMGDAIRPLKREFPQITEFEQNIWLAIAARYGLPNELPDEVKLADDIILAEEKIKVMSKPDGTVWGELPEPSTIMADFRFTPYQAEIMFMSRFLECR